MIGILTNTDKYSIFKIGDMQIKFKTSPFLQCILRTSCHVYTVKLPHRNGVLATVARQLPHYLYNI